MFDIGKLWGVGIDEVDACRIRGIAVSDESDLLIEFCSADSLLHGDDSVLGVPGVCEVISGDFEVLGRDKEEDVIMFAHDFDISFITGAY